MGKTMNRTVPAFRSLEINFHQKTASKLPVDKIAVITLLIFSLLGFGSLGWLQLNAGHAWAASNRQLTQLQTQIAAAEATNKTESLELNSSSMLLGLPTLIRSERIETTVMLDKLALLIPYEVNLSSLSFGEDGSTVKVTGLFASTEAVISFEQAVRGSVDFKLLQMSGITKVNGDIKGAVDSSLTALQASFELQYGGIVTKELQKGDS